jgi:hypothetical protein
MHTQRPSLALGPDAWQEYRSLPPPDIYEPMVLVSYKLIIFIELCKLSGSIFELAVVL